MMMWIILLLILIMWAGGVLMNKWIVRFSFALVVPCAVVGMGFIQAVFWITVFAVIPLLVSIMGYFIQIFVQYRVEKKYGKGSTGERIKFDIFEVYRVVL